MVPLITLLTSCDAAADTNYINDQKVMLPLILIVLS